MRAYAGCMHNRNNLGSGIIFLETNLVEIGLIIADILFLWNVTTYIFEISYYDTFVASRSCIILVKVSLQSVVE